MPAPKYNTYLLPEDDDRIPAGYQLLNMHMQDAIDRSRSQYDDVQSPEADRYRHVMGMRRASLDPTVGPLRAFIGGTGHEINNIFDAIVLGNYGQLGTDRKRMPPAKVLRNSYDDMYNNMVGIMSAIRNPEPIRGKEEVQRLLDRGRMPLDIRKGLGRVQPTYK